MKIKDIKFKAKRLDNGEWVEGDLMKESYGARIIEHTSKADNWVAVDHATVCQFTGEKDMNGTEIYIGDIISNLETRSAIEVVWNDRLKRLDCKILNGANGAGVPFGIFVSRYKRIVVLMSKFDKEK